MKNPVPRYAGLLLLAVVALLFSACTSAEELMEDGAKLENEGRYEEALRKYIRAYDKDPEIVDLDIQITDLGNRVVADLIAQAAAAEAVAGAEATEDVAGAASDDDPAIAAAETYMKIDELVLRAFEVGIALDVLAAWMNQTDDPVAVDQETHACPSCIRLPGEPPSLECRPVIINGHGKIETERFGVALHIFGLQWSG